MKIMLNATFALLFALVVAAPIHAEEGGTTWDHMKKDMNQAGKNVGKIGKKAGSTVEEGGKNVGNALKKIFSSSNDKGKESK